MTPTEQDKELRRNICGIATGVLWGKNFNELTLNERSRVNAMAKDLEAYITADRKRAALEAELELLTYLLDERTEHMFMQNPDTGEMTGSGWLCNTSLSAVSANRIEAERRKRIAELKAQQEEVK